MIPMRPTPGAKQARRRVLVAALLLMALPAVADAQTAPRTREDGWRTTRVAKWTLLATAVALGVWTYAETERADDNFDALRRMCERDAQLCTVENGRYANAEAERLYDATGQHDRRARVGIFAGQTAALGSAAFFILDLRHRGSPDDIPYDPSRRGAGGPTLRLGLRITR